MTKPKSTKTKPLTASSPDWFAVDRKGLSSLLGRQDSGPAFAVIELVSNAWDAPGTTRVDVTLEPVEGKPGWANLSVEDDSPEGFTDLSHAWTLWAPSEKTRAGGGETLRGRFNLGEKLVLSLASEARVESTTAAVAFGPKGREILDVKRERGSRFTAVVKMTKAEVAKALKATDTLIPPPGIATFINGEQLPTRTPVRTFEDTLPTEIGDEEGNLRPSRRRTVVNLYEPLPGEKAHIYELGIPVVPTGDRWHVDIQQKVPLNFERNALTPAVLQDIRTAVMNNAYDAIDGDEAAKSWVRDAISDKDASREAVEAALDAQWGPGPKVSWDPSDLEANRRAVSEGASIIHGRSLPKPVWDHIREHDLVQPAGKVFPTAKPEVGEDGEDTHTVDPLKWTPAERQVMDYAKAFCSELLGVDVRVRLVSYTFADGPNGRLNAWYGAADGLTLNRGSLGRAWFERRDEAQIDALLIHEAAHHKVSDHLDRAFYDECCRLGALARRVAVRLAQFAPAGEVAASS